MLSTEDSNSIYRVDSLYHAITEDSNSEDSNSLYLVDSLYHAIYSRYSNSIYLVDSLYEDIAIHFI